MIFSEVRTERLTLIAMTLEALAAEQEGRLAETFGCEVPESWPPEHWEAHVFDWLRGHYERSRSRWDGHRYVALRREDGSRLLIGTVGGFTKEPGAEEAEIGTRW